MLSSPKYPKRLFGVAIVGNDGVGKGALLQMMRTGEFNKFPMDASNKWTTPIHFFVAPDTTPPSAMGPDDDDDALLTDEWTNANADVCCYLTVQQLPSQPINRHRIHAAIIMFDLTSPESFHAVSHWQQVVRDAYGDVPTLVCGNKADLLHGLPEQQPPGDPSCRYRKISVKKKTQVDSVVPDLIRELMQLDKTIRVVQI